MLNTNESELLRQFHFLPGGGKTGKLIRSIDWSETSLGGPSSWPHPLKNTLSIVSHSHYPMIIFWGAQNIQLYNDAFMSMIVEKHPLAMGMSAEESLNEAWPILWPQIQNVMLKGKSSWNVDQLISIIRNNRFEEVYWTYGMSPILSDEGIPLGVLMICSETTAQVLSDRRMKSVLRLEEKTREVEQSQLMFETILEVAFEDFEDLPYVQLVHADSASMGIKPYLKDTGVFIPHLNEVVKDMPLSWHETITSGFVLPMTKTIKDEKTHILFGLSPRLPFDWHYRDYLYRFVSEVDTSIQIMLNKKKNRNLTTSLKEAVTARDTFLGIASHELKNPLTSLKLRTDMNLRTLKKTGSLNSEKMLEDYLKQIEKLNLIVEDMLDIARIASGKLSIRFEKVDLSKLVEDTIEGFKLQFEEKNVKVIRDVDQAIFCEGDSHRLEQVLTNLFTNVTKYAPESEMRVVLKKNNEKIELVVSDNGPGFSTDKKDLIFSKFERLETKAKVGGLGLGLYICKNIVESHQGEILVDSDPGKGTTFTIHLPVSFSLN